MPFHTVRINSSKLTSNRHKLINNEQVILRDLASDSDKDQSVTYPVYIKAPTNCIQNEEPNHNGWGEDLERDWFEV